MDALPDMITEIIDFLKDNYISITIAIIVTL